MKFYFIELSNAFQSNVIYDPSKRHYMHLPSMYMQWFCLRFPNYPLSKVKDKDIRLVIQTIRSIQGTKDAGHEWYKLLSLIFTKVLGMVPSTSNNGLFYWKYKHHVAYVGLVTDDILMEATHLDMYDLLRDTFTKYFEFTSSSDSVLHFLNYRLIQSKHGTSIDQYVHIHQTILHPFFASHKSVPFQSNPFPLDPAFEMELYTSTPLPDTDIERLTEEYNGSYNH